AHWRQAASSSWNCSRGFPLPGSTITLGPVGTVLQAPSVRTDESIRTLGHCMVSSYTSVRAVDPHASYGKIASGSTVVTCQACGHENPPGQKFCGACGTRLSSQCTACG